MEKKKSAKLIPEKGEPVDFEKAMKELENIAEQLEDGELGLDDSISRFERGITLARFCRAKLDEAERKIEILQKGEGSAVAPKKVKVKNDTGEIEDEDELQGSLL